MAVLLLVTPDEPFVRKHQTSLESMGHVVIWSTDTPGGVERLREGGIDAVLVDHGLPTGAERFVAEIHRLPDPPPFVLLSRDVDAPALSARLGAAAFLPTFCDAADVLESVARVLPMGSVPRGVEEAPTRPLERPE